MEQQFIPFKLHIFQKIKLKCSFPKMFNPHHLNLREAFILDSLQKSFSRNYKFKLKLFHVSNRVNCTKEIVFGARILK